MAKRKHRRRSKKLLLDKLNETLPVQVEASLKRGLPPDADPFQRICFEILKDYAKSMRPPEDK